MLVDIFLNSLLSPCHFLSKYAALLSVYFESEASSIEVASGTISAVMIREERIAGDWTLLPRPGKA